MRKILTALAVIGVVSNLTGCTQTVEAGSVGVVITKPYIFGAAGVDPEPMQVGRGYFAPSTELVLYSVQPRRLDEKFSNLITKQNVPVSFDAYIQFHVIPEKVPMLHQKFGIRFYENNLEQPFRTMVRDFARTHTVFELTTDVKVTNEGQDTIFKELVEKVKKDGMPIVIDSIVIGAVMPPKEVLDETARTQAQQQRIQTENARAVAELSRKEAEQNKALADKAYAGTFGMTAREFLTYRSIENQREMIEVVKDKSNVNVVVQAGGLGGSEVTPTYPIGR